MVKAYYHLPGLFEFYELYRVFLPLYREHRDWFYDWCEIGSIYGAPADCIWGGGRAGFGENDPEEVLELMQEYGISARLTFSNSLLRQEHLSDRKCNALCRLFERNREPRNGVIIYSELLLEYLKEQYPGLYFVSSTTKVLTDFTQFEEEIRRKDFRYVVPDFRLNKAWEKWETLTQSQRDKVEFLCNECCSFGCKDRRKCYETVSRKNVGEDCPEHECTASDVMGGYRFSKAMKNPGFISANDIKKIVDEVNKISHKTFGEEKDLIGRVYEYFLKEFAVNATKEEGEFYTPHDVVQLIATMIEPYDGTLYDPCCGSGGMFIQSAELVKSKQGNLNGINVYGQEKEPATYRLAKMNLALRGISHNLGEEADSSFTHDLHKGLHFNYIMANPPFNLKGWYNDNLKNDGRWSDYQTPPESNANYAWILHILSHLKKADGVAGFLLANGALNDSDTLEIRKELIQNDKIEAIVVLPRELFITTDISVTLWILNQNKKGGKYHGRNLRNREHEMLFMDLRQWTENAVKGENKKKVRLDTEQIEKAADIYHTWQCEGTDGADYEMPELYRSVGIDEIENKGWALTPSKYIEFIDHDLEIDYEKEMARIQSEMKEIMMQEKKSQQMLEEAFRGIGYGID